MSTYLKVYKGTTLNTTKVPIKDGQLLFETDTKKIWLDSGTERLQVGGQDTIAWDNVTGKPYVFAPSEHSHSFILQGDAVAWVSTNIRPMLSIGGSTNSFALEKYNDENHLSWHNYVDGVYDSTYTILDNHNYNGFALPLSGGTLTGNLGVNGGVTAGTILATQSTAEAQVRVYNSTLKSNLYLYANTSVCGLYFSNSDTGSNGNVIRITTDGAKTFYGDITGNAASATSVAWSGVTGKPSYYDAKAIKSITRSGTTFTYTCLDGTTGTFTQQDNNTTYSAATTSADGLMTAAMVTKLNGIATGANAYTLPAATSSTLGGVKIGSNISVSSGTISLNSTNVTTALGYIPVKSVSLADDGTLRVSTNGTSILHLSNYYLPLAGGSITGNLTLSAATSGTSPQNQRITINGVANSNTVADAPGIGFHTGNVGWATMKCVGSSFYFYDSTCSSYVPIYGSQVHGAIWNDYAEYRATVPHVKPGQVVLENGDGTLRISTERLQPGCEIVSDTFGFAIGETDDCKTPIAATGRVLAYTYEDRNTFVAGEPVCSGPNGTVSRMTREEAKEYPERIIGTVSEIPSYTHWGTGNVEVDNRIWIRIR